MYSVSSIARKLGSLVDKLTSHKNSKGFRYERLMGAKTRRGYVPMYVGKESKRYDVPVKYLSIPVFQEMLLHALMQRQGDLDTKIEGPIRIPCSTWTFDELLKLAKEF